jgi:hypothetical protein
LEVKIRDQNELGFMTDFIPAKSIFQQRGATDIPGALGAEMIIPAGRAFYVDAFASDATEAGGPWRIWLGFSGVLLNGR